ncbi:interleukin-1 receptor type 1 [Pimephales promelas]|uniref:interleukin-1 receptor type 1 n=1 Tax=Pimephales promelas TaxID=90988 RepID=UPI00195563A4|nr:interleukin-1 receptor type 1 [Pimephales promelas]XP_039527391.1 interleukin-1 receptor type 1 [Pimephales promelas]KAG1927410.1 interleukin-1 receptor type [Pimephales promelas]KAG1927411.1 interleukin-1 receptor type [Pimephales promelas]
MSLSTVYFLWILLSTLWLAEMEMPMTHRRSANFVAGLVFNLHCERNSQNVSVSWSRVPRQSLGNITGITIKDNALWFLPAELVHSGEYSCFSRNGNETQEIIFEVSVQNETCPRKNREDDVKSIKEVECFLPHVFELDPGAQVSWRKNCHPLDGNNRRVFPMNRSDEMVGLYTCFVNFTLEGLNYSAAQTTNIYSRPSDFVVTEPKIIYPQQETHTVTLGKSFKLCCKALVGKNAMEETDIYWMSESLTLNFSSSTMKESEQLYALSVLFIPEVTYDYLNTDLTCVVLHPAGSDSVKVQLILASQKERLYWIGLGLVALVTLLGAVALLFRVDLVLVYRDVCSSSAVCSDGKSYDAYVSYLHGDRLISSSAMTFALHSLPEMLEDLYGYKLFISGRDELPGEAVHEVIADRMSRSRRLIIVLTSQSQTDGTRKPLMSDDAVRLEEPSSAQMCAAYEQRVGVYDALVKQGLKVLLVQVEDGVEEASLPESLRFIRRSKGILQWRQNASDRANRRFWKYVRYHMPPAQRR